MAERVLTLPYPPSANRYWRALGRGHVTRSREAKAYLEEVGWLCRSLDTQPVAGDVEVEMRVYRPARRRDLDNHLKVALDALQGHLYHDDKQIVRLVAERYDDKANPRLEVTVREVNTVGTR